MECSIVYIGQTGRSVTEHVFKTEHAVDLSQSKVLDHDQHTAKRCMLASWFIQHNQAVLNREQRILLGLYVAALLG